MLNHRNFGLFVVGLLTCLNGVYAQDEDISSTRRLAISPDGKWIAAAVPRAKVKVWNAQDGKLRCEIDSEQEAKAVAFNAACDTLLIGTCARSVATSEFPQGAISAWYLDTDVPQKLWQQDSFGEVMALGVDRSGRWLALNTMYAHVAIHDLGSGRRVRYWTEMGNPPSDLAFDYEGQKLITAGQALISWQPKLGDDFQSLPAQRDPLDGEASQAYMLGRLGGANACVASRHQPWIVAAGIYAGTTGHANDIVQVDINDFKIKRQVVTDLDDISCLALAPDEQSIAVGLDTGKVLVFDLKTHDKIHEWNSPQNTRVRSLSYLDDKQLVLAGFAGRVVAICNVENGEVLKSLENH